MSKPTKEGTNDEGTDLNLAALPREAPAPDVPAVS